MVNPAVPIRRFLYYGAVHFDRWVAPTPIVLSERQDRLARAFLEALVMAEPADSANLDVFQLHDLRTRLYELVAVRDLSPSPVKDVAALLDSIKSEVAAINRPMQADTAAEFAEQFVNLEAIIEGVERDDCRFTLSFALPHPVAKQRIQALVDHAAWTPALTKVPGPQSKAAPGSLLPETPSFARPGHRGGPVGRAPSRWSPQPQVHLLMVGL